MPQPCLSAASVVTLLLCGACYGQSYPNFAPSQDCALCHSRIPPPETSRSRTEASIAPHALWEGSMMANAAKDPFWRAKVRYESEQAGEQIERKCLRCHAPARQMSRVSELDAANEGVTCTVCHQIGGKGLGSRESLTGGFVFDTGGKAFGPHKDPFTMPMQHHTDLTPAYGPHVLEAAFCGTCHTVITHPMDTPAGTEFVEQAPFLEWLASSWSREGRTCQSCHMPQLSDEAGRPVASYIAHRPPGGPFPPTTQRTPFGQHFFIGGNYQMAPNATTATRAVENLKRAVSLQAEVRREGERLRLDVTLTNLTGHKVPTAYPSRRLWVRVQALDAKGGTVFESGGWDQGTGELTAGPAFQPHRREIDNGKQVQIYESEYLDAKGSPTLSLARAASYRKDNRILPRGFRPEAVLGYRVDPAGTSGDGDFVPGRDLTTYFVPAADRIVVEVLYQSIKPAHAAVLKWAPRHDPKPVVIARVEKPISGDLRTRRQ